MTKIVAQIAPQRSTQYGELATTLAPYELRLSSLGAKIGRLDSCTIGGQAFLRFHLPDEPDMDEVNELGMLALTTSFYVYYDHIGDLTGPFLKPIPTAFVPALPPELVMTRRYRGKTNELFTHFLCNVARFSSRFADTPWTQLRLFDPLAGGGTTLFTALVLGADAAGIEHNQQSVNTTVAFLTQFSREQRIPSKMQEERLRKLGQRWTFTFGKQTGQRCVLVRGETDQSPALIAGFKPHLMVTDLPYGIQHQGPLVKLLSAALPVWASMLPTGGVLVFAWDATRFTRSEMIGLVESTSSLLVLNTPPYDRLAHRVDRVIKQRDILVARRA